MRVLSVHQPWAELIMLGRKRYELRAWKTGFRGRIAIHASLGIGHHTNDREGAWLAGLPLDQLKRGVLVGTVEVVDCTPFTQAIADEMLACKAHFSGWLPDHWAWELREPERLQQPVRFGGKQGLFRISDFVQYHKPQSMVHGSPRLGRFWILTNKPWVRQRLPGRRVWLIAGEASPRRYTLRQTFIADEVRPSPVPGFEHLVSGGYGMRFQRLRIDGEPWFREFQREQGNFAFGLSPIREEFADELVRSTEVHRGSRTLE